MPITKSALLRFKIIDRCLRNKFKPFPSVEDLRQACEDELFNSTGERISKSTIEKDLSAMRTDNILGYNAPIKYHQLHKGYYYEDPGYSIQALPLNTEELQAIRFASQTLYQFRDTPFFRDFYSAIDKIFSKVSIAEKVSEKELSRFIQFEEEPVEQQLDNLPLLIHAVIDCYPVSFSYHRFDSEPKNHFVHPLLLKEYRNRWYLCAFVPEINDVLVYGLDRIHELKQEKGKFKRPADFDPVKYFMNSLGITTFNNEPSSIVELWFHPSQSNYLRTKPLHHSQKIISDTSDGMVVSIKVQQSWELESLILGYGELVKVHKPESLMKKIKDRVKKQADIYN